MEISLGKGGGESGQDKWYAKEEIAYRQVSLSVWWRSLVPWSSQPLGSTKQQKAPTPLPWPSW